MSLALLATAPLPATSISSISVLLAALTAVLGGAVVLSGRRRPASVAFIILCANVFVWHLASIYRGSQGWRCLSIAALLPLPLTLLRYLRIWLSENRATAGTARPVAAWIWPLLGLCEIALCWAYLRGDLRVPEILQWLALLGLYAAQGPIFSEYRRSARGGGPRVTQRRLFYLLLVGLVTVSLTALDYLDLPRYVQQGPAVGTILTVVYLYFLQQTLSLDRLLDLGELVAKVAVLTGMVLVLSAIWTVMALLNIEPRQVIALVTCVTLILFEPLRSRLESQVQRWTVWERYELTQHVFELRQQLSNVIDPREAVRKVLLAFEETGRMTHASVYLLDGEGLGYDLAGHFGSHPSERIDAAARRPLWQRLLQTRRPLTLEGLQRERRLVPAVDTATLETLDVLARALGELQAGAVLGLFAGGRGRSEDSADPAESLGEGDAALPEGLLGLLCVKDERVSDAYTLEELELLAGVAAQLCITLQNSKLYERMKERDRLAALGEMAAGLAHEIRNPLGAIKGAAELLAPGSDGRLQQSDEDAADFLRIIVEETRRLNRVVSQFLDYARPYRGELQAVRVDEVIHKTLPLLPWALPAPEGAGQVAVELMPQLPAVRGDPEQLRQVFLNLALNAIEAMSGGDPATQRLIISTALRRGRQSGLRSDAPPKATSGRSPAQVEVRFSDTGPGISAAHRKSLFIPFFTTKERGTGLGLSISQRIIENHGGTIEVSSRPGAGATFTVVLPVWDG